MTIALHSTDKMLGIGVSAAELDKLVSNAKPYLHENYIRLEKKFPQIAFTHLIFNSLIFTTKSPEIIQNGCWKTYEEAGHARTSR